MGLPRIFSGVMIVGMLVILGACTENQDHSSSEETSSTNVSSSKNSMTTEASNTENTQAIKESEEQTAMKKYTTGSLLAAAEQRAIGSVEEILKKTDYVIDETDAQGNTPLNIAVHNNDIAMAKLLIDHQADINQQNSISDSPYLYAAAQGKTEILAYMLENATPDLAVHNRFGGNGLIPAAEKGHIENVKLLLEAGQEPIDFQNDPGYTALIEAVALRDGSKLYQDIVKLLMEHGADQDIRDNSGRTALDYAKQNGYTEIEKILEQYK